MASEEEQLSDEEIAHYAMRELLCILLREHDKNTIQPVDWWLDDMDFVLHIRYRRKGALACLKVDYFHVIDIIDANCLWYVPRSKVREMPETFRFGFT